MNKFTWKYKITLEGNDLDVKAMQKLKSGDLLKLARVSDGEDTFEITVSTSAGKLLDMLDYCDSVGVAPFIDDGSVVIENATVDKVFLKQGKSRAKDRTTLFFNVEYSLLKVNSSSAKLLVVANNAKYSIAISNMLFIFFIIPP